MFRRNIGHFFYWMVSILALAQGGLFLALSLLLLWQSVRPHVFAISLTLALLCSGLWGVVSLIRCPYFHGDEIEVRDKGAWYRGIVVKIHFIRLLPSEVFYVLLAGHWLSGVTLLLNMPSRRMRRYQTRESRVALLATIAALLVVTAQAVLVLHLR